MADRKRKRIDTVDNCVDVLHVATNSAVEKIYSLILESTIDLDGIERQREIAKLIKYISNTLGWEAELSFMKSWSFETLTEIARKKNDLP